MVHSPWHKKIHPGRVAFWSERVRGRGRRAHPLGALPVPRVSGRRDPPHRPTQDRLEVLVLVNLWTLEGLGKLDPAIDSS